MHGIEHRVSERRALRPLGSPSGVFLRHLDRSFLARRSFSPQRDWLLVTAFPSPATAPPFEGSIPGSMFPACYFAPGSVAHKPVRPSAPLPLPVRPGRGRFLASARCLFASSPDQLFPRPPLPFGTFTSLWIEVFNRLRADQSTFRLRPISSRSPLPVLFLVLESDQRSWSATFPEARCSSNLLEPHSLCAHPSVASMKL